MGKEDRLEQVVLCWLWCQQGKPSKQQAIATAMKPFVAAPDLASLLATAIDRLVERGEIEKMSAGNKKGIATFGIALAGQKRAAAFLGREHLPAEKPFAFVSNVMLPAIALRLPISAETKPAIRAFGKLLPLAVCVRHFQLDVPLDSSADAGKLALLRVALGKWNGVSPGKIHLKGTKAPPGELPAIVAAPLLGAAGTAASNLDRLLEATAANLLGAARAAQVRPRIVARWLAGTEAAGGAPSVTAQGRPGTDVDRFAQQVQLAARRVASHDSSAVNNLGDQVLIHQCWREFERASGPLPFEQFRQRLAEANNSRRLVLVREDLVPEERAADFRASEVVVGGSRYHYVRINK